MDNRGRIWIQSTDQVPDVINDKKDRIFVFNKGGVYLGLKLIQSFNVETGMYSDPVPRVTYIVNDKFNNVQLNGKWWREYADFVNKFVDTLDGLATRTEKNKST